jgi:hypothetical protein
MRHKTVLRQIIGTMPSLKAAIVAMILFNQFLTITYTALGHKLRFLPSKKAQFVTVGIIVRKCLKSLDFSSRRHKDSKEKTLWLRAFVTLGKVFRHSLSEILPDFGGQESYTRIARFR